MDIDFEDNFEELAVLFAAIAESLDEPIPQNTSILSGAIQYAELLVNKNETSLHTATSHASRDTFVSLVERLKSVGLTDGEIVCAGETLMIFLHICIGFSNRECAYGLISNTVVILSLISQAFH